MYVANIPSSEYCTALISAVFEQTKSNKRSVISAEGLRIACQCIEQNNKLCLQL